MYTRRKNEGVLRPPLREGFSDDEIFTFENSLRKVLENLENKEKDYE